MRKLFLINGKIQITEILYHLMSVDITRDSDKMLSYRRETALRSAL